MKYFESLGKQVNSILFMSMLNFNKKEKKYFGNVGKIS